jgi:diaminopimelate epimerase
MKISFTKAHGAKNDFLLTWERDVSALAQQSRVDVAIAICDRHTGVGADGWLLVAPDAGPDADAAITLYNSDGSIPELSGNGTRCAAAFLIVNGHAGEVVRIRTGAGIKTLRLLKRDGLEFEFEMDMGRPEILAARFELPLSSGPRDVTLLSVGNPQCAIPVTDFDFDWRAMGAEIERHPHFPNRTNVSFVKPVDEHAIEVRIWERGAGETMSSGTGSTGAAAMAVTRGMAKSPVEVRTPAGPIRICMQGNAYLTGPAALVAEGLFLL